MSSGSSVFEITQSLGDEDAGRIKRLLENGVKIPAQPRVLDRTAQADAAQGAGCPGAVQSDQSGSRAGAMLFKVVGNRAYRQHQPFDSVEQILHAVGVRQTFNLVQAISLSAWAMCKKPPGLRSLLGAFAGDRSTGHADRR
jgi:hypothetical protein